MGVDVDPEHHRSAHPVLGTRFTDARGVVVNQVALEIAYLFVREDDFRELPDAGVDPVHYLARLDALLEESPAAPNSFAGFGMEFDAFAVAGDRNDVFDCEVAS